MKGEVFCDIFCLFFFLIIGIGIVIGSFGILLDQMSFSFDSLWLKITIFLVGLGFGGFFIFLSISELNRELKKIGV